jgi:uncharacterized protein (DUF1330 family)
MSAYLVALRNNTKDASELSIYSEKVGSALPPSMQILAAYGQIETLEGPPVEAAVILKFPTYEEARAWYEGAAYQDIVAHRWRGASYQLVIVQGL